MVPCNKIAGTTGPGGGVELTGAEEIDAVVLAWSEKIELEIGSSRYDPSQRSSSELEKNAALPPSGAVLVLSLLLRMVTGPVLLSLIAVLEDCLLRPANCDALFEILLIRPGDLDSLRASLIALWLDFRDTMDSGSSKCGGRLSYSRPRRPSGEPCIEELFVRSWALSGDITGEA